MTEGSLKAKACDAVRSTCPRVKIYNHQDRFANGMPDTSMTWNDRTSWLEFKLLEAGEDLHQELSKDQLMELLDLERACKRAWVVAYRKPNRRAPACLDIFRPSRLTTMVGTERRVVQPVPDEQFEGIGPGNFSLLWDKGVIRLAGHNHAAVAALIKQTHS